MSLYSLRQTPTLIIVPQEKDDIDKVVIPDLDDLLNEQDDGEGGPVDEEDVVSKFMDEKFFSGEDGEDEDEDDNGEEDKADDEEKKEL